MNNNVLISMKEKLNEDMFVQFYNYYISLNNTPCITSIWKKK